jgi:PAS domain S-box-containing protein
VNNKTWTNDEKDLLKIVSNIISNSFERKTVLNELKNSELRLNLAINSAKEGFWDWNIKTGDVYYSEMWCKMLGYEQYEIPQDISTWEKLVYPDDLAEINKALNKHFLKKTDYYESIHRVKTKEGSWKWILDHGKVIEWDSKNKPYRAIGTHIDITNQKNTEQQLQELIDTKDKLFSIIAHDLRGPIANFQLVLELMTNNEIEIDEKLKTNFLNELKKASKNTGNLLENLLNWSKSQTNVIKIKPMTFEINTLIRETIDLSQYMASLKTIEIFSNVPQDLTVYADIDTVNLVIRNLLNNAIKFTPINGWIKITGLQQKNRVIIAIEDNGTGINKEVISNLFNPSSFYSSYGTNNEKGSGIGLILCKDFANRNNGDLIVESTSGKGSKFSLILPKGKK